MKTKLLTFLAIISFISLYAHAQGFDKKSATAGVLAGMYVEHNKENILSWSRLIAFKTLEAESKKYNCKNLPKPSQNGSSEYIRGLCTFVHEQSKQDVFEGLNALSFAVLNTYEDKKEDSVCAASLALFTSRNYSAAQKLANMSKKYKTDSNLCETAQNIVALGLRTEIKYHGIMEPGNVCVGK